MSTLVDRIYEAAFVPEFWPSVLGEIADRAGAMSGALLLIDQKMPPLYTATDNVIDVLADFAAGPNWYNNERLDRLVKLNYGGFLEVSNFSPPEERAVENPYDHNLDVMGARWQVGSAIIMPGNEVSLFTFERTKGLEDFDAGALARLDVLRPHLARASLINMRLGLEKLKASIEALALFDIPAAALRRDGSVVTDNAGFEALSGFLRPAAHGRVSPIDRQAGAMLREALLHLDGDGGAVRSIPCRTNEEGAVVLHVVPLHRSASDLFERGWALLAVTGFAADANVASQGLLRGLFDLSAAEAGIATSLASGLSPGQIAEQRGVGITTVRTHLAQIFRKTGTSQQAQLVALLKGMTAPIPGSD